MKCLINFILGGLDALKEVPHFIYLKIDKIVKCNKTKTHHKLTFLLYIILTILAFYGFFVIGIW